MIWELSVHLTNVKEYVLPPPAAVFEGLRDQWPKLLSNAWTTTVEILAGYALAIVVSIPLALLIAFSRIAEETVYPVVVFFQIIPKIAVAPLFIIWFGFGFMPKLLLVFLLSFFPIVVSSIAGFKSINPEIVDFVKTTGANAPAHLLQGPAAACASRNLHRPQGRRRVVRDRRRGRGVRRLGPRAWLSAAAI